MLEYRRFYVGERLNLEQVLDQLMRFGYQRVPQVADPGDLAVRGGILDIFPATFECPLRLELAGSRLASIRGFNPVTFETLDRHSMVVVLPRQLRMRMSGRGILDLETPFEGALDLTEGDLVVHLEHGIGRFCGRTTLATSQGQTDALILEYAGGDRLYVPMDQLHLVQRYVGFGSRLPALHTLGGSAWERAKAKAYLGAWTYANELLSVQARRLALPGHTFSKDHEWQRDFERAFPYRETPDQLAATEQVKQDMEDARPMDRLLLGDVGYGKTEVALRAAFKTVMDQKQAAVLVPTTILAYQHARTFTARLQAFPVQVETLSRFQTPAEQHRILEALRAGACDIVIGTHRLLSGDVQFKDLGLLIIDEEQRFGVREKEQLKAWRTQVDVLVLSATPIPRTLYLALMGSREMSLIMTPPENRHPVETAVAEDDDDSLRRWIRKELARQGQVYVVHNRVYDIHQLAARIRRLVPEARVGVGHGQLPEEALERTVLEFIEGRLDVLVTTTIIESGIDIPNANTLIVNRADQFGLADLYQLRGRVGRFTRKAYAYLLVPRGGGLSQEARERLRAIMQHTELGAGFKIAMEDLKLRGAGNLLGIEQHGHITAVGFDLYCRLLREAITHIKHEQPVPVGAA
ncbi:MAG: transcription-repair coupling factor [Candidatus Omnitrophica bacterium]|nr:transcription-repair coupling factor [Candidatus Omnitrophota bacterium]